MTNSFDRRSHQRLLELPSRLFYGDALLPCADQGTVQPPEWSELNNNNDEAASSAQQEEDQPNMLFYGVRGQQVISLHVACMGTNCLLLPYISSFYRLPVGIMQLP